MADGSLDFDEFMACTKKLHALNGADEKELRRLFESYKDGENGISHDCFQYAVAERLRERFAAAFSSRRICLTAPCDPYLGRCVGGDSYFQLAIVDTLAVKREFQYKELSTVATRHLFDSFDHDGSGSIDGYADNQKFCRCQQLIVSSDIVHAH